MHSLLASFLGPMFAKELVEIARRKRYFVNRVVYGLVLVFTLFVVWDNYRGRWLPGGRVSIHLMAEMAEAFFHAVSGVQYGAVFLFVPLFLCGVIASEREERTLELLFTTRLTNREIVLGKLGSRIAVVGLLVLFTLPVLSGIMLFGGVDPLALWRVLACTLLAVLYTGAHAIYFSTVTKSAMGALVRTYWWMAVWLLGVPLAVMMPVGAVRSVALERFCVSMLVLLNPVFMFAMTLDGDLYNRVASVLGAWFFPFVFVLPSGWSCFLLWRAVRRLRLAPTPLSLAWRRILRFRRVRQDVRAPAKTRAQRHQPRPGRVWWGFYRVRNPLWLRARLTPVYDREGYIRRIQWFGWLVALFFLLMMLVFETRHLRSHGAGIAFVAPSWLAFAALTVILSGTSLVGDRRRGFLDLVLLTPLTAREIVDGTLLSIWEHVRRTYWLPCALALFFLLTGSTALVGVFCSIITATLFGVLLMVHGTACSLTAKTLPGALVPTFLFPILVNLGIVFLMPTFRDGSGPALWLLSAIFLVVTWFQVRRRTSVAVVGSYFMAVHLVLASLATGWTWTGNRIEYPIAFMHPAFMTVQPLDGDPDRWFQPFTPHHAWYAPLVSYWIALAINIVWARWWLIRHFDRLTERPHKPAIPIRRRLVPATPRPLSIPPKEQAAHGAFSSEL